MANYANLKSAIQLVVKENHENEITGALLQQSLLAMINSLGGYYQFAGIATPSTNPGTPDQNVFYLASIAGTYSNFAGIILAENEVAILKYNGSWTKDTPGLATSEKVNQLEHKVTDFYLPIISGKSVDLGGIIGATINLTPQNESGWNCVVFPCAEGDAFIINGMGGYSTRLWGFVDSENELIEVSTAALVGTNLKVIAPVNSAYFVSNANGSLSVLCSKAGSLTELNSRVETLETDTIANEGKIEAQKQDILMLNTIVSNNDAKAFGGNVIIMPPNLSRLDYNSDVRLVKFQNGKLIFYTNNVESVHIGYADPNYRTNENDWMVVDGTFWTDNTQGLYLPVELVGSVPVKIRVGYLKGFDSAFSYSEVQVTASGDFEIKSLLIADNATSYMYITHITVFGMWQISSPYAVASAQTPGFKRTYEGEFQIAKDIATKGFSITPFAPYIYHFDPVEFIKDADNHNAIAGESLEDVIVASRLGYDFIEANIHKTSDDKYVVIHGESGKFGALVKSINPSYTDTQIQQMAINSVTLDFIKQNIRYNSYYTKYQTQIPTLDEFLQQCKVFELGVVAGVLQDEAATKKCIDIVGNNLIVYSAPGNIRDYFNGYCDNWFNTLAEADTEFILARAKAVGAPYIAFIGPTVVAEMIGNDTLDGFIQTMHENGFLVGTSYYDEETGRMLQKMGVDVFTTTKCSINRFEANYEVIDLDGDVTQFTTTGSISDGVATLANSNILSFGSDDVIPLGKGSLTLRFNGKLAINFGSQGSRTIQSDGNEDIVVTDYFFRRKTKCVITATAATEISGLVYLTSKC